MFWKGLWKSSKDEENSEENQRTVFMNDVQQNRFEWRVQKVILTNTQ